MIISEKILLELGFQIWNKGQKSEFAIKNYGLKNGYFVIIRPNDKDKPFLNVPEFRSGDSFDAFKTELAMVVKEYEEDMRKIYKKTKEKDL